jgi:alpha-ketoglutarate-dependent taurine dioxygenase
MDTIKLDLDGIPRDAIRSALREVGFALLAVPMAALDDLDHAHGLMTQCLEAIGQPIQVFDRYPTWRPIGVDPDREPARSEGIGESPLHMDFVNAQNPPEFVLLYCQRDDPMGGGSTLVASTTALDQLPTATRDRLGQSIFSDGRVVNLHNIGMDINPFAVAPSEGQWRLRYTGQLLRTELPDHALSALRELEAALRSQLSTLRLEAGEAILLDQRRVLHGRAPLGNGQDGLHPSRRRQLWQRFARVVA